MSIRDKVGTWHTSLPYTGENSDALKLKKGMTPVAFDWYYERGSRDVEGNINKEIKIDL